MSISSLYCELEHIADIQILKPAVHENRTLFSNSMFKKHSLSEDFEHERPKNKIEPDSRKK